MNNIWQQKQNWIKDILSKSGTEITEIKEEVTDNGNGGGATGNGGNGGKSGKAEHRTMVYYTALPLMMQQQSTDPNSTLDNIKHEDDSTPRLSSNSATLSGSVRCAYPMSPSNNSPSSTSTTDRHQPSMFSDDPLLEPLHSNHRSHQNDDVSQMQQPVARPANSGRGRARAQPKPQFKCDQCNMMFGSKSAHTSHIKSHGKTTLKAQQSQHVQQPVIQQQMFPPSDDSNDTGLNSGPPGTGTFPSADPYQCDVCHKTFAVPARLVRHYRTHTGERPFECEFCHKMFSVKENLQVHRRIHTKERPYKCDVCGRAFEHSGKLHRHMRIHTGERPHKCSVCGKTFIQSGQLVIHMRTHTGEKPYKCPVEGCGKGFTCSKQLKVHSRTHTGEKPYHCDICFRDFGYNHVLKLHRVQHYGSKCYKCTICDETFKNKKEMEAHIKGHANELPDEDATDASVSSYTTIIEEPVLPIRRVSETDTSSTSSSSIGVAAGKLPETPRETSSSDAMSDAEDLAYYQMYPRFNSSNYGSSGHGMMGNSGGGVNPALLAAVSMAATAAAEQDAADAAAAAAAAAAEESSDVRLPMHSPSPPPLNSDKAMGSQYRMPRTVAKSSQNSTGIYSSYEPLALMRQQGYFAPVPNVEAYKSSLEASNEIVKRVEAALAGAGQPLLTPPRSSPESPDRASSPESESQLMANRANMSLPLRKRKLYHVQSTEATDQQQQQNNHPTAGDDVQMRISSVIQFAKAT